MVGQALKGEAMVPLERLEVNNIHSCGGCVVLEDASRRYELAEILAPLSARNGSLVRAMVFGGLLTAPSVAPFFIEARTARLAMFCGLDADKERFDAADLMAALRDLDEQWARVCALLAQAPHTEMRAITLFRTSGIGERMEIGALGMDAEGVPLPLIPEEGQKMEGGLDSFLQQMAGQSKAGLPLLTLDEELAGGMNVARLEKQPYLIELGEASLSALLKQLNQSQLMGALRSGAPVEVRHNGKRYILASAENVAEAEVQEAQMRMGSIKELTSIAPGRETTPPRPATAQSGIGAPGLAAFRGLTTNVPQERLSGTVALEWATRAQTARTAFSPVQIVVGKPASGEGVLTWRNHQHLQFVTHWLRCKLYAEWSARGETRPVEDVLRDLQEVHRATLTVDGTVVRRLATKPSRAVMALLERLKVWDLFETPENGKR